MKLLLSIGLSLATLASAHYDLNYPVPRGVDYKKMGEFPCGGLNTPSPNRTEWPLTGGPVELRMGHDHALVQVLLGLGDDVGSNFNIVLVPTVQQEGTGEFCMASVQVPADLGVTDGTNATLQVVTNGDPEGGLYACADITFRTSAPPPSSCTNNTGVTAVPYSDPSVNANGTSGAHSDSHSNATSTSATPSAPPVATGAAVRTSMEWGLGGVLAGALGFALLL